MYGDNPTLLAGEGEGGNKPRQTKTMVTVEMRQEYMIQTGIFQPLTPHGQLRTLPAINHEEIVTVVYYLTTRQMA